MILHGLGRSWTVLLVRLTYPPANQAPHARTAGVRRICSIFGTHVNPEDCARFAVIRGRLLHVQD